MQQVSAAALAGGVDLTTVGGAASTWSVKNKSPFTGVVALSGYTAVGFWNGDPNNPASNGVVDIEDAVGDPGIDVSAINVDATPNADTPATTVHSANTGLLINYMAASPGSPTVHNSMPMAEPHAGHRDTLLAIRHS